MRTKAKVLSFKSPNHFLRPAPKADAKKRTLKVGIAWPGFCIVTDTTEFSLCFSSTYFQVIRPAANGLGRHIPPPLCSRVLRAIGRGRNGESEALSSRLWRTAPSSGEPLCEETQQTLQGARRLP